MAPGITVALGFVFSMTIPLFAQWQTSRVVSENVQLILSGNKEMQSRGAHNLKGAFWCNSACYTDIVKAYHIENDSSRRAFLAGVYLELTGQQIDSQTND